MNNCGKSRKDGKMREYKSTPNFRDFVVDNLGGVVGGIAILIILFICGVLFIPVKGTMEVKGTWWDWQIPINKFSVVNHTSDRYPTGDAYDINSEQIRHTRRVVDRAAYRDSNGTYHPEHSHNETYYTTRYHYKKNEWVFSYNIPCSGTDKSPHEAECDIPYAGANPQLGDLSRGSVVATYGVTGIKEDGSGASYDVSKSDWERIEKGGTITYKYRRINKNKIYDIAFK